MSAQLSFNRGIVSPLALVRVDLKRLQLSAETQTNWMPRALGPMMLRPGLGYLGSTRSNAAAKFLEFVYSSSDMALVELTDSIMRVWIDDVVVRRPAVTSKFNRWNGAAFVSSSDVTSTFVDATDVGYWKDNDESGGTSALATGGYLSLLGDGNASAIRDRSIAVVETNVEHSINIIVNRGAVVFRAGTTEGGDDLLGDRTLRAGYHSLSITPTAAAMFLRLSNSKDVAAMVDSVTLGQSAADMELTTPWTASDLDYVRYARINDVFFVACAGIQPKRIERQGADSPRSWSVVEYAPEDGPFRDLNTGPVRLKASALTGDVTLTAERAYFKSTNVGSLFSLDSAGQEIIKTFTSDNVFTDPIRVTGVGTGRAFTSNVSGSPFTSTTVVTLQRSVGEPGDWVDIVSYNTPTQYAHNDTLDNQIIYYRLGIKTGNYTALDRISASLIYAAGSITGIARVTAFTNSTTVSAQTLTNFGKAGQYTADWREGDWSARRGYPSSVCENGGRLHWQGKGMAWGSVPDQLDSFDDSIEGDSAPIRRSLGEGAVDTVNWSISAQNLLIGLEGSTVVARSTSFDEPLTQTRFDLKPIGDMGTAAVPAIRMDTSVVFVGGNESKCYEVVPDQGSYSYGTPTDLTALYPEAGDARFVRRAFQRFPDRRLHLVRGDGTVGALVFDRAENVTCWVEVETDGEVEDVVVLPGATGAKREDRVYYVVKRTINGQTKRYLEKWATEAQSIGATDTRLADSHIVYDGAPTTILTGLDHLEGEDVVVWQDGVCPEDEDGEPETYTVSSGQITLNTAASFVVAGLYYEGMFKSAKRALADTGAMLLTERKKIDRLALVLANTHYKGIKYGEDFDNMDGLPLVDNKGAEVAANTVHASYDKEAFTFNGTWSTDPRLCLKAQAPRPCTVMAAVMKEKEQ